MYKNYSCCKEVNIRWRLKEFYLGGSLKKLIKKELEYIELSTKKKN